MGPDGGNHPSHTSVYDLGSGRTRTNHKEKKCVSHRVQSAPGNVTAGS